MLLENIIKEKRRILEKQKTEKEKEYKKDSLRKTLSLRAKLKERFGLIAEIKRASPSAGVIKENIDVKEIALVYSNSGAAGISVLTCEPYFSGRIEDIKTVREVVDIPILMKDFIFDPYQIYLGRIYGADLVLLILRILSDEEFLRLLNEVDNSGMEALVEVHTEEEVKRAISLVENWENKILGINNRDLDTLKTDLYTTLNLIKLVPQDKIVAISESGIKSSEDIKVLKDAGVNGVLVGESLLKSKDIKKKVQEFL